LLGRLLVNWNDPVTVETSRFRLLTLVSGEQTAHENACFEQLTETDAVMG
jgi:hypothetical protein